MAHDRPDPRPHPILALWAHPRSMSTAIERVMRARGDLAVFHEPFLADYYLHRAVRRMPMLEAGKAEAPDYAAMRAAILAAGEQGPVFFKDMSYYVVDRVAADPAFARRLTHVFLIRDPRAAIASYWRKDPDVTCEEIGIEAAWRHLCALEALGLAPMVIEAEAVAADAEAVIGRVWARAGLPFAAHAFAWKADAPPAGWAHVAGWHDAVIASTGIRRAAPDPGPAFAAALAEAPHLAGFLDHHLPVYEKLWERAAGG